MLKDGKLASGTSGGTHTLEIAQTTEAPAESEIRQMAVLESSLDGVMILNEDGLVQELNLAAENMLGYSVGDGERRHWFDFVQAQEAGVRKLGGARASQPADLRTFPLGGRVETTARKADGTEFPAEIAIIRVHLAGKEAYALWMRDLTDRRQLESQLWHSQKMEAVGRLAGGVAHDFNNLVTVIGGYSDLLLMNLPRNSTLHRHAEEIKKAGDRAASLTRQLLAFSRRQVLEPRVLDLNAVIGNVEKMLRRLIGEDIVLSTALHPGLWPVKTDPGQLEQVLLNLAVNARDAMPGGGKLTIETGNVTRTSTQAGRYRPTMPPGQYVLLAVSDTGAGIDPEIRSHIFEPFFTTKEEGKGTGLGLATVYGIVKQSGGYIWVYSEPGQGASFKIYLPRAQEVSANLPGHAVQPHLRGGTETILVTEDEGAVRKLVHDALESAGYKVLEAEDAREALRLAGEHNNEIDLLLTDVVMPGINGRELAGKLRLLDSGIRVVYMSGYAENAIVHHGIVDRGAVLLQKPFTPDELVRKVRETLDSHPPVLARHAQE